MLDLTRKASLETYRKIILAIEEADLETWAKEVVT